MTDRKYEQSQTMLGVDKGADMRDRQLPCDRETYCILGRDHADGCQVVAAKQPYQRPAWDTKTPDPSGWRLVNCTRCGTVHAGTREACPRK